MRITDTVNFPRTLAGLCLIAAPTTMLAAFFAHPGGNDLLGSIIAHPQRVGASNLLIILSSVFFIPALIGVLRFTRGRATLLGHLGAGLMFIGVLAHSVWAGFQLMLVGVTQAGVNREQLQALVSDGPSGIGAAIVMISFLLGFFLGSILLALALWRSRSAPRWVAVSVALMPLVDFIPIDHRMFAALGPVLLLVSFGYLGLKLLALPDREWLGTTPTPGEIPDAAPTVRAY